jgi:NADH:ubiquinone oxidoreductase subunit E
MSNYTIIISLDMEMRDDMTELKICVGSACNLKGSYDVIETFKNLIKELNVSDKVEIKAAFCLGRCTEAVSVDLDGAIYSVSPNNAEEFFEKNVLKRVNKP